MKTTTKTNSPVLITDLEAAIMSLESDLEKSINAQPLFKTLGMQIMLIALDAKAELVRHTAPGPISVQVIKGSISFRTDETVHDLAIGGLLTLEGKIPHSVYGNERSIFLVTKSIPE
ncbi:MAG TPA: hypothetical protein VFM79_10935 [Pelobium sp.]|nr:hypothetical protein [Pelobium sp.]